MVSTHVTIINKLGLHARAAAKFSQMATGFRSEVTLARSGKQVNAKSIMGVMLLAAGRGTELELRADGPDEEQALAQLRELIGQRFGEEE